MNERKQIEAMAKLDGIKLRAGLYCTVKYLTDHDAVWRVIEGLDGDEFFRYVHHLRAVMGGTTYTEKATCPQKVEAILKAAGLWEMVT